MFTDSRIAGLCQLLDDVSASAQAHARNLANQDTPGYRVQAQAQAQAFSCALADASAYGWDDAVPARGPGIALAPVPATRGNDGNDVSLEREMTALAQDTTRYDAFIHMLQGKLRLLSLALSPAPGG